MCAAPVGQGFEQRDDGLPLVELAPSGLRDPCALGGACFGPVPFLTTTFPLLRLFLMPWSVKPREGGMISRTPFNSHLDEVAQVGEYRSSSRRSLQYLRRYCFTSGA